MPPQTGVRRLHLTDSFRYVHDTPRATDTLVPELGHAELRGALVSRIRYSHGGAILLGGFRGTGKTTLVASALRQLKNELTDEYVVVSTINVARPMSSTELLFTIMRRLVEALDDAGVMSLLDSDVRSTLLLSYARTSLSLSRQSTESAERSTTTGLSVSNPLSPLGKSGLGLSPRLEKTTKTSRSLAVEASFLAYADGDVEHDFARIVQLIAENPIKIAKRWAPWKRIEKPVRLIVVLDELDKLTATDKGIDAFEKILSSLKNVLATSGVHVLLVAGVDVLDRSATDSLAGIGIYESVFAWSAYVPCMWESPRLLLQEILAAQTGADNLVRGYLSYRTRGVPRRLFQEINDLARFDLEGRSYLGLRDDDLKRMELYAELDEIITDFAASSGIGDSFGLSSDRQRLACYYATDWILRSEGGVFTPLEILSGRYGLDASMSPTPDLMNELLEHFVAAAILERVTGEPRNITRVAGPAIPQEPLYRLSPAARQRLVEIARESDRERVFLLAGKDFIHAKAPNAYTSGRSQASDSYSWGNRDALSTIIRTPRPGDALVSPQGFESTPTSAARRIGDHLSRQLVADWAIPRDERLLASGRYELIDLIGAGGFGVVYRATDTLFGQECAIKLLRGESADQSLRVRFLREGEIGLSLSHPGLVRTLEILQEPDGRVGIVMELVAGKSLRDAVSNGLSPIRAVWICTKLLEAIEYCHGKGIIRLDLKPENIILQGGSDEPKIVDLGVAKRTDSRMTQEGAMIGTPAYMAPEQWELKQPDERADIFALGLILYEALGGDWNESSVAALGFKRVHEDIEVESLSCSLELRSVLRCLLARNPEARISGAREAREALLKVPEYSTVSTD